MVWAVTADRDPAHEDMKNTVTPVIPNQDFPVRFAVEKVLEGYGMS